MARPLEGVKCVCVIMFQQLSVAFSMMADLGAEIIKVEPPEGELGRQLGVTPKSPLSPYFETNNRGFKCITLDLKTEKAKEILYKLVKDADVFAQNFRPGVAERLGCGYEDLIKVNPGIVYISASAYGPDGPNAKLPGTDGVAQAAGGVCFSFGEAGTRVTTGQVAVADETAAFHNFQAVMVGLYHKLKTGEGQLIESSLLGSQIRLMGFSMTRVLMTGEEFPRSRTRMFAGQAPNLTATFSDKDGKPFIIQVVGEERWRKGLENAGLAEELDKVGCARLGDIAASAENRKNFLDTMDRLFATDTREHWLKLLREADVVSAPINTLAEAAADPDVIANNYVIEVDHPRVGKIKEVGFPWKFSKTPAKAGIAPELGEHNNEVLEGLGYSDADIKQLKEEGVI
ncbi:Formyl-CoA:oxalate CoA-transferase [subsurface metagenome]|nr:CoA transferase [Dehalococcoidia bacterium]